MTSTYQLPGVYAFERPVIGNYGAMSKGLPTSVQHVNMTGSKYQGPVNPVVEDVWPKVHKQSGKVALTADIRQCETPNCEVFVQGRDFCLTCDQRMEEQARPAQAPPAAEGAAPTAPPLNIISPPQSVPAGAGILHSVSAVPVHEGGPVPAGAFQAPPGAYAPPQQMAYAPPQQYAYPAHTVPAGQPSFP